jgi:hypothetical protein
MGKRARAMLVVVLLAAACSKSSDLSGQIAVAGKSGEVVRGTNVDVILLPANEAFAANWSEAVDDVQAGRVRARSTA